ncbi:hypothetical protein JLT2_58 [Paraglaciecola Antarctic JLT virus 2]|nr:hypothetical protein JLT2_58 [Paraglaciecola Antarctic JLT virus 2]
MTIQGISHGVKSYRKANGISLDLPCNYKRVWEARMPHIKILVLHMGLKEIAEHYNTSSNNLSVNMANHEVSANVERHRNKLRMNK